MTDDSFRVSRRVSGTPYDLVYRPQGLPLIRDFHSTLTPMTKAVAYGLFALTEGDPDDPQEASASDILDVIDVAKQVADDGVETFHGQHYRDAFNALEKLFNVALPLLTKRVKREGRRTVVEKRVDFVRLLESFGLVYLTDDGREVDINNSPDLEPYRVDIRDRREDPVVDDDGTKKRPRKKRRTRRDDDRPVFALVKVDKQTRLPLVDATGRPQIRPPTRYGWRWSRQIVEDLKALPNGRGWLTMNRSVFRVLRNLRHANNGRGNETAARLFDLITSDILAADPGRQHIEKAAKLVFGLLGFPEPGTVRKGQMDVMDGRWTENVDRVAEAVRLLKIEGVLLPESDEEPYRDPNPNRRPSPYYRWKRGAEWTFTSAIAIVDRIEELAELRRAEEELAGPNQQALFPEDDDGQRQVRGRDIRAAREKVGLTLRDFVGRFGRSLNFWSQLENEELAARTGKPRPIPEDVRNQVEAFVADALGWSSGNGTEGRKE